MNSAEDIENNQRPAGQEEEMKALWNSFVRDDSGQSLVEYGLVIALVALAVVGALIIFSGKIASLFGRIGTGLDNAGK